MNTENIYRVMNILDSPGSGKNFPVLKNAMVLNEDGEFVESDQIAEELSCGESRSFHSLWTWWRIPEDDWKVSRQILDTLVDTCKRVSFGEGIAVDEFTVYGFTVVVFS